MKIDTRVTSASLAAPLRESTTWLLFFVAFFGTCALALTVQLVLLPTYLPHLHAGHGMLIGGDSEGMHSAAVALAERIHAEGWSAWELRPAGNAPTGIAAAMYVYFTPEPYTLVPLNALVHAAGGLAIYLMAYHIFRHRMAAATAAIPFLMFPSAASWYAQIHKDGIFALGMLLYAAGWMLAFRRDFWKAPVLPLASLLGPIVVGLFLVWLVRPHMIVLMQVVALFISLSGLVLVAVWWHRGVFDGRRALMAVFVFVAIPVMTVVSKPSDYRVEGWKGDVVARELTMHYMPSTCVLPRDTYVGADKLSSTVAGMRDFFISGYPNAKSNIDPEFVPGTVCNLLAYLPRALQIGFLAPFPSSWLADGSITASTMMRRISSVEVIATYLALLLLPIAFWDYGRKPEFWFLIGFFTILTIVHVYLVPNLGTLHRMRYGFLTAVVGFAMAAGVQRVLSRGSCPNTAAHC